MAFQDTPDYESPFDAADASGDQNDYLLNVIVTDGTDTKSKDPVRVMVTNVNEPPSFPTSTTTRTVGENAVAGEDIGAPVEATDPDKSDSLTYELTGSDDDASFEIGNYSGQLQTKTGVDYGAESSYTVTVTATDQGGLTDTITVTITTNEENDAPVFTDGATTSRDLPEQTGDGTPFSTAITATDEDNDPLTYTLEGTGTDKDSFTIDNSGQIKTKTGVDYDYETKTSYSVTVQADDSNGGTDTIAVTITVTNVDEPGTVTFSPTPPKAGTLLTATVTDPDGNVSGEPWEWFKSDSANTGFNAISGQTLETYTPTAADVGKFLKAKVMYTDDEGSGKTAEETTAAVTAANTQPTFPDDDNNGTPDPMTFNVAENSVATTLVGTVSADESDADDTLTFSLGGDTAEVTAFNAAFDLDTATGKITVLADDSLDHETTDTYTFDIDVSDGKDAADQTEMPAQIDSTVAVTISVTDVNEAPTFDETGPATRTIVENTAAGEDIGAPFTATDPDDGDTLTYTLDTNGAAFFDIDASGQLKTKTGVTYDYETTPSYSVTVSVRDSKDDSGVSDTVTDDTIEVTITVTNVEEDGTVTFTNPTPQARIELTASVADPDVIVADSITWQWAISPTSDGNFTDIQGQTNASYTPADTDVTKYLRATANYTDGHGANKTASGDLTNAVRVAHNPNQPPTFTEDPNNPITFSIAENTPAGQDIGTPVTATDPDQSDTVAYSLDPTSALVFQIGSATGQIQTKGSLNHETGPSYTVTVTALDPGGLTDTIDVTITVTDVDEPPGKPDAPTVTAKTSTHDALTVTWAAPTNTGPDITSYAVQYRKHDVTQWTAATGTITGLTADITDLLPDTEYLAGVQATNDEGTGEWSDEGAGTTAVKPQEDWFHLTVDYGAATYTVTEGGSVTITVTLSAEADRKLEIPITDAAVTAETGDYAVSGLTGNALPFVPGETSQTFTVVANRDSDRSDETLTLEFGALPTKPESTEGIGVEEVCGGKKVLPCIWDNGFDRKTNPREGAPFRCYHVATPTASKSPSTITAWWPTPG